MDIAITCVNQGLELLPPAMDTPAARVMLFAIGQQESKFKHRRQLVGSPLQPIGPAKSYWQAEMGGGMVHGVRVHSATREYAARLYEARGVEDNDRSIWNAIENDNVLACALARLLLWSDPYRLPKADDVGGGWQTYLRTWRPGAYARGTPTKQAELRAEWSQAHAWARSFI